MEYLAIPKWKGIFSRDSKDHLHKEGCRILNLDDEVGVGTHWVAHQIKGKICLYFDSFSMPPPVEFVDYANKLEMKIIYNGGHPLQDLLSVRRGYYCLYFLHEIQKKDFYDVLKVFSLSSPKKNEAFIKKYFLSIK